MVSGGIVGRTVKACDLGTPQNVFFCGSVCMWNLKFRGCNHVRDTTSQTHVLNRCKKCLKHLDTECVGRFVTTLLSFWRSAVFKLSRIVRLFFARRQTTGYRRARVCVELFSPGQGAGRRGGPYVPTEEESWRRQAALPRGCCDRTCQAGEEEHGGRIIS